MSEENARFVVAHAFLQSRLTNEGYLDLLNSCQIAATELQHEQHTYTQKEHDSLVLMELEKNVMALKVAEKIAKNINPDIKFD